MAIGKCHYEKDNKVTDKHHPENDRLLANVTQEKKIIRLLIYITPK